MFARATLGDPRTAIQVTSIATTATAAAVAIPGFLLPAAAAGPIAAGIVVAGAIIAALIANSGCGPTCVLATRIVDQLEPQLAANRDQYLSGRRTLANRTAALANFDYAMDWLKSAEACGAAELGDAGRRCISDRIRGGKSDWYSYYRDPIEAAAAEPDAIEQAAATFLGTPPPSLMLAAALIVLGVLL
jgi:hypothetical protein